MMRLFQLFAVLTASAAVVSGFAFVPELNNRMTQGVGSRQSKVSNEISRSRGSGSTTLSMVEQNVIIGAGIAVASFAAGIGLVSFTESQGERAKARGGGLSDGMSTKITGKLMEDVEVSSVQDLGSLTSQLEQALKESGGANMEGMEMTEEEKNRIAEELDDGW